MALASWRPPGLPQQPPEVSRPCQKQLSPRSHLLQVVSEALDIPVQQQQQHHQHQQQCQQEQLLGVALQTPEVVETSKIFEISRQSSPTPPTPSKTNVVTASDGQISNGFVLHGQNLPYVFEEATDPSGARKKSSKILPVCAVCGKKFVCVTTMKRHLVTHTGEKPFSCKICGKQYTQKGNLRVHERTHRNDRPFQCQICHQKFYRKEPMQKHQWRQHGIVHLKSGRTTSSKEMPIEQQQQNLTALGAGHNNQSVTNDSAEHPKVEIKTTAASSSPSPTPNENNNNETSPIKLKMKLAYQQQQQILLMDQCKIEQSPNPIFKNSNSSSSSSSDDLKSSNWIQEDKPLDLSCSKSNNNNSIIPQQKLRLSDINQPSQLPITITEKTNTKTTILPFSKTYTTTITNVPTTTIQMSDATGTLSKLLQNFSTKSTNPAAANNNPPMPNQCSKLLLHGLFQSEGNTRTI